MSDYFPAPQVWTNKKTELKTVLDALLIFLWYICKELIQEECIKETE
jgi:hypothetical protein